MTLREVTFVKSLISIGNEVFGNCTMLSDIHIKGLADICDKAFGNNWFYVKI